MTTMNGTEVESMEQFVELPGQKDVGGAVGHTPLVYLNNVTKGLNAKIAVKLEYLNPGGSVKDRMARNMIDDAEKKGKIFPGKSTLVDFSAGNTGIALAYLARIKGYKLIILMPNVFSVERRAVLKAFGAEVILTDHPNILSLAELRQRAFDVAAAIPYGHCLDQMGNPANPEAHYRTTGPEIWEQTQQNVDIVCFGVGTGGTVTGVGRFLKEVKPEVQVFPVEPYESSVISGFPKGPHKIQGIGAGAVPEVLDRTLFTEAIRVTSDDAIVMAKRLANEEGLLAGISSGANVCAAIQLAQRPENAGKLIVTSVNSFGERYLSTELYSDIREEASDMPTPSYEETMEFAKKYASTDN